MDALILTATDDLPFVHFDKENSKFELRGRSIPNDAFEFFQPIIDWTEEYIESPLSYTQLHCELEYFNSSTQKNLVELFKRFNSVQNSGHQFKLHWYYREDDEELMQIGQIFQTLLKLEMEFIVIPEEV